MGPSQSTPPPSQQKLNQNQVLNQAKKLVQQLKLFQSQTQFREQRHLLARILIYGHSNLIAHLRTFPHETQRDIMRDLKAIDYETTDLLYQNLVVNKMKQQRKKINYAQYDSYRSKSKQMSENVQKYKLIQSQGEQLLSNNKVAILIFAGGISSRFLDSNNNIIFKETYVSKPDQKCLLEVMLDKLSDLVKLYEHLPIYLVHNENNLNQLTTILQKYSHLTIKKLLQNQNPVVNLSGKLCLKTKQKFQIITAPRGCGDFANLYIKGDDKLMDEMSKNGIQYVQVVGIQNILASIVDPYMIGVLASQPIASVVFKCTYPDNENQNLKRVVYNKSKPGLQAIELESLLQSSDKSIHSILRRSPVWTNNILFRISNLRQYIEQKKSSLTISHIFTPKRIQHTYWNPSTNSYLNLQHCYMFEREINSLVLNDQLKSIGIMVERERQFMPVYTINGQWSWQDAYNQYLYSLQNERKKIREVNYYSTAVHERSEL